MQTQIKTAVTLWSAVIHHKKLNKYSFLFTVQNASYSKCPRGVLTSSGQFSVSTVNLPQRLLSSFTHAQSFSFLNQDVILALALLTEAIIPTAAFAEWKISVGANPSGTTVGRQWDDSGTPVGQVSVMRPLAFDISVCIRRVETKQAASRNLEEFFKLE